ncbi:MAG: MCE family protein [Myxococcales bacterium]|nr:MCE family protein [Myxococcales bacterium]
MARRNEARTRLVVGLFVLAMGVLLFISLFIIGQSEGTWESKTEITTDFRTITGLRRGSPVQLAGVEVGRVQSIDFVSRKYLCDPLTEDVGRYGAGRTDNCDEFLFCAPTGICAELEPYAAKGLHAPCLSSEDCGDDEVCVTAEFRRKAKRVSWSGTDGVCARYITEHRRVQVTMKVFADKLELIRSDSRATVASNGVLGDQLINVTPGMREALGPDRRIQSTPSLIEDIELFRERFTGLTDKVDSSLSGISTLFSELNDERTIGAVKGIVENLDEITKQVAEGQGLVGALFNDPNFKEDVGVTLRKVRDTAAGLDSFVTRANSTLKKVEENVQPLVDDGRKVAQDVRELLEDLEDPKNKSLVAKLLRDDSGEMTKDLEKILDDVEKITGKVALIAAKIERGEGTVGKLISDSKVHDDLVKLFDDLERNETLKALVRGAMDADDAKRDPAKPANVDER